MKFRHTPERLMTARMAFRHSAEQLLPFLCAAAGYCDRHRPVDPVVAAEAMRLIESREAEVFGAFPSALALPPDKGMEDSRWKRDTALQEFAGRVDRRARWARRRAQQYQLLAAHRALSAELPKEYRFDGEIDPRLSTILVERRKAWARASARKIDLGVDDEAWRTLDISADVVRLSTPNGGYALHRAAVIGGEDGGLADFRGKIVLDATIAARGGVYRVAGDGPDLRRLENLSKSVGPFVLARALIRTHGRFLAPDIIRRLREKTAVTFRAGRHRTEFSVSAGKKQPDKVRLAARASRLLTLADEHRVRVANIEAEGRRLAEEFAADPRVHAFECGLRLQHWEAAFVSARDDYNGRALRGCYKDDIKDLPYAAPPSRFPSVRSSLGKFDRRYLESAQNRFEEAWKELHDARASVAALAPELVATVIAEPAIPLEAPMHHAVPPVFPPKGGQGVLGLCFA